MLVAYKRLLSLARRLPGAEDRARAAEDSRAAFRRSRGEADPAAIAALLRTAHDKLSYLRMVTPRLPGDAAGSAGGLGRLAVVDGELREVARGAPLPLPLPSPSPGTRGVTMRR